jgi:DNA-binding NtrC family response regulator
MIKKMDHLAAVPVYMYSTAANPASIAEVKKMGAADFIIKPADYDHLVAILAGIVQRKN